MPLCFVFKGTSAKELGKYTFGQNVYTDKDLKLTVKSIRAKLNYIEEEYVKLIADDDNDLWSVEEVNGFHEYVASMLGIGGRKISWNDSVNNIDFLDGVPRIDLFLLLGFIVSGFSKREYACNLFGVEKIDRTRYERVLGMFTLLQASLYNCLEKNIGKNGINDFYNLFERRE